MTAPTEEEIRAVIARSWTERRGDGPSVDWTWSEGLCAFGSLIDNLHDYDDMRESEIDRLDAICDEERRAWVSMADTLRKAAIEALVRAELRFWAEHPTAPRPPARAAV